MVSLETAEKALKTVYLSAVTDQLNKNVSPFFSMIEQTENDITGSEISKLVVAGYNGGVYAGGEADALPKPGNVRYHTLKSTLKNLYGTLEITDKAIRASQNNAGAFVNLLNAEMEGLLASGKYNLARMIIGRGDGLIAKVEHLADTDFIYNGKNLAVKDGMTVDLVAEDGTVEATGLTVLSVDRKEERITLSRSFSSLTGNYKLVSAGAANEIVGLQGITDLSSESLYGLNRAENAWLNSEKFSWTGETDFDLEVLQEAFDMVELHGGSAPNVIVGGYEMRRRYINQVKKQGVKMDYTTLDGGQQAVAYNGVPFLADRFAAENEVFVLNTDCLKLHRLCDWRWLEGDGGSVLKQKPGQAAYTATLVKYADLICDNPSAISHITALKA